MNKIALIGNYPPRKCGIATFTKDLNDGMKKNGIATDVVAMNDGLNRYNYPEDVVFEVEQNVITSYINAAEYLNSNDYDAVILQHEFGIFGGPDGIHIIQLLKRLRMPVVTTLHTIIDDPTDNQRWIINELARLSQKIISISQKGIELLTSVYGIPASKCVHIHHGVHNVGEGETQGLKKKLGVKNKKVLLTFGLLSRNKSIEVVIKALPEVVKKHPDVVYIVLGATHPHVIKHEGEDYRHSLFRLVNKLKLENNVLFVNRFVSNEELFTYLKMCDIYVIPYLGKKQISSGTLIYTMGAAKPIISTPFWYAEEMLADNRGMLFDFKDSNQLSELIIELLDDEDKRKTIGQNAFSLAKECYWPKVAQQYFDLLKEMTEEASLIADEDSEPRDNKYAVPPINLDHLHVLTDYTGILQHARFNVPDRNYGYCTDDNARALLLTVLLQNEVQEVDEINQLTSIYLSFLDYAYNPDNGKFRNFMNYERKWLEKEGSEDSFGRTMWALGYTAAYTNVYSFYLHSEHLFNRGLKSVEQLTHPRSISYAVLGLVHYTTVHGDKNKEVRQLLRTLSSRLNSFFDKTIHNEWPWFEHKVSYGNSRIPEAMIFAGSYLKDSDLAQRGLKLLDWLIEKQFRSDVFSPIGNAGWLTPAGIAPFDQQPLEANGMIDACLQAVKYTRDSKYGDYALKAFYWFTGENDCSQPVYDFTTGGCRDGLHSQGVNLNQGAESTLSWLISLLNISFYLRDNNMLLA